MRDNPEKGGHWPPFFSVFQTVRYPAAAATARLAMTVTRWAR